MWRLYHTATVHRRLFGEHSPIECMWIDFVVVVAIVLHYWICICLLCWFKCSTVCCAISSQPQAFKVEFCVITFWQRFYAVYTYIYILIDILITYKFFTYIHLHQRLILLGSSEYFKLPDAILTWKFSHYRWSSLSKICF